MKLPHRRQQTTCIGRRAQKIGCLFQRFVIFEREHHYRLITITDQRPWSSQTRFITLARFARAVLYVMASIGTLYVHLLVQP